MARWEMEARAFCSDFVAAPTELRFILGTGDYARSIGRAISIQGYVDDYSASSDVDGIPVIRSADLPPTALVVVASMLRPRTALDMLRSRGIRALSYFAFARFSGLDIQPVTFWSAFAEDYHSNQQQYASVRERLADRHSVALFDNLVRFRLEGDLNAMADYAFNPTGQYFEDFLNLDECGETFVDVGSFDGHTSLEFAARAPDFARIYAFEPSAANISGVERNLAPLGPDRVTVLPYGLGDHAHAVRFHAQLGSSSRVSDDGESEIQIRTMDSLDLERPTFIKMDIEGAEIPALRGARTTISTYAPRLAIAAYHRFDDFWRIPEVVDEADVPYRLFLRHYTEGIDETVMFFIPNGSLLPTRA